MPTIYQFTFSVSLHSLCHSLNFSSYCLLPRRLQLPSIWSWLQALSPFQSCPISPSCPSALKTEPTLLNMAFEVSTVCLPLIALPIWTSPRSDQITSLAGSQTHVQPSFLGSLFPLWGTLRAPWFPRLKWRHSAGLGFLKGSTETNEVLVEWVGRHGREKRQGGIEVSNAGYSKH